MGKPTDEEIGRAVREFLGQPRAKMIATRVGRLDVDAIPDQLAHGAQLLSYADDDAQRAPYTTEDLRAALAVEREAEAKSAEPLNLDIWSDEYAPETDSPLLAGVFGQESTGPGWLNSPLVTTQRPERAQVASGDDIDAELARYGVGKDAPSIFDGVEILF